MKYNLVLRFKQQKFILSELHETLPLLRVRLAEQLVLLPLMSMSRFAIQDRNRREREPRRIQGRCVCPLQPSLLIELMCTLPVCQEDLILRN